MLLFRIQGGLANSMHSLGISMPIRMRLTQTEGMLALVISYFVLWEKVV